MRPDGRSGNGERRRRRRLAVAALAAFAAASAPAAGQTEFHFQFGELLNPFSAQEEESFVLTLQQATQWKYGDSFFFVDYLDDKGRDGFNERDFNAEWYPTAVRRHRVPVLEQQARHGRNRERGAVAAGLAVVGAQEGARQ